VLMEHLRERNRRLIADAGRSPDDGFVDRFEHERGLVHPARDQVTVHGGLAGMHNGFGDRCEDFRERHRFGVGLGFGYYPYEWDYSPDYGYYGYSQPYSSQIRYYCSDPAGYYPYVAQCNTSWQTFPASRRLHDRTLTQLSSASSAAVEDAQ